MADNHFSSTMETLFKGLEQLSKAKGRSDGASAFCQAYAALVGLLENAI